MTTCVNYYNSSLPIPIRTDVNENNCMGIGLTSGQWIDYWSNTQNTHLSCTNMFNNLIFSGPNRTFNQSGYQQVQEDFNYMFSVLYDTSSIGNTNGKGGNKISTPGSTTYNQMQDILINACSNNSQYHLEGACENVASSMCNNCTPIDITSNVDLLKLCGCQVSSLDSNIIQYNDVSPACDPLCAQDQVSKKRNADGTVENCNSTVCVINNISIATANSLVGGVNFTQICPQCVGDNSCICIVDSTIPDSINNTFTQYCGTSSVCLTIDPNTNISSVVPCKNNILEPTIYNYPIPIWVWILSIFIIILVLIICVAALYIGNHIKVINKNKNFIADTTIPINNKINSKNFKQYLPKKNK
jgi:hypothetical protein